MNEKLCAALARVAEPRVLLFKAQGLANIAWAFATTRLVGRSGKVGPKKRAI